MGLIAVDAGVMIGYLDHDDAFHNACYEFLLDSRTKASTLLPTVAYAESLVAVLRSGMSVDWYADILGRLRIHIGAFDAKTADLAASLRVAALHDRRKRQWKMPDALIVAETLDAGADRIVTTDSRWPAVSGIEVQILKPT